MNLFTFKCQNSTVWIHKSGICSNRTPQRLRWHAHINNYDTVLRCRLSNTNILIRFHSHVCESNELLIDPYASQLQSPHHTIKDINFTKTNSNHKSLNTKSLDLKLNQTILIITTLIAELSAITNTTIASSKVTI